MASTWLSPATKPSLRVVAGEEAEFVAELAGMTGPEPAGPELQELQGSLLLHLSCNRRMTHPFLISKSYRKGKEKESNEEAGPMRDEDFFFLLSFCFIFPGFRV